MFQTRRAMAMRAYYEHMPLRQSSMPDAARKQMQRGGRLGNPMDVFFLDTRQYRSDQVFGDRDRDAPQGPKDRRGYVLCDVGRDLWRGDLKFRGTIAPRNGTLSTHASFVTARGKLGLQGGGMRSASRNV